MSALPTALGLDAVPTILSFEEIPLLIDTTTPDKNAWISDSATAEPTFTTSTFYSSYYTTFAFATSSSDVDLIASGPAPTDSAILTQPPSSPSATAASSPLSSSIVPSSSFAAISTAHSFASIQFGTQTLFESQSSPSTSTPISGSAAISDSSAAVAESSSVSSPKPSSQPSSSFSSPANINSAAGGHQINRSALKLVAIAMSVFVSVNVLAL